MIFLPHMSSPEDAPIVHSLSSDMLVLRGTNADVTTSGGNFANEVVMVE